MPADVVDVDQVLAGGLKLEAPNHRCTMLPSHDHRDPANTNKNSDGGTAFAASPTRIRTD